MFQHFILTRFNLRKKGWDETKSQSKVLTDSWMENRLKLFEQYCYSSIKSQTVKNFEWLVFSLEQKDGYWEQLILEYYRQEYKDGLGPNSVHKMVKSMVPEWWGELMPAVIQKEVKSAMEKIKNEADNFAQRRAAKFS